MCNIKARITPEHKIHKKAYNVDAVINEQEEKVVSCECTDCSASEGGCKHGVAFLLWLHRRSEEPSTTSTLCYWKGSSLSKVGRSSDLRVSTLFGQKKNRKIEPPNKTLLKELLAEFPTSQGVLFQLHRNPKFSNLSLHQLGINYKNLKTASNIDEFMAFMTKSMSKSACLEAELLTRQQSNCPEWFELRFGRITASLLYETARSKTFSGSLKEKILGANPPIETEAINRGKKLESEVIKIVSEIKNININKCGLFLNKNYPIFGASPDGISDYYVIEVKCPYKEKSLNNYISSGKVTRKFYFQMQLQMLLSKKHKGLFCVASPNFEVDKEVQILDVDFDEHELSDVMDQANIFWKNVIYPVIID